MKPDYSSHSVRAQAYLRQADDFQRNKEYDKCLEFLKLCDNEIRQAIAWVDEEIE